MNALARSGATATLLLLSFATASSGLARGPLVVGPDLQQPVSVLRDADGLVHVFAAGERDMVFAQGWAHARDRLFQMDLLRRQGSGTLAELLGPAALPGDVEARTLGLRRAAERSLAALSPETRAALDAYADGVNAWRVRNPPPPEYALLEIGGVEPWTALDSVVVGKAITFSLSFDLDDIDSTTVLARYQAAGTVDGFDGSALFFQDTHSAAPFAPASVVPDAGGADPPDAVGVSAAAARLRAASEPAMRVPPDVATLARSYAERVRGLPLLRDAFERSRGPRGSNAWVVAGQHTDTGRPLLANDPHLPLTTPSAFYPMRLHAPADGFDVIGDGFAGIPYLVVGHTRQVAWGFTVNPLDVTDVFAEEVRPDPGTPSGLATVHRGVAEPLVAVPVDYRFNVIGDGRRDSFAEPPPGAVPSTILVSPRRDDGPILALDLAAGRGLSVQWAGLSPTRELDAFRALNRVRSLPDFRAALRAYDVGSQNVVYADLGGTVAYMIAGEVPLREDLEAGRVRGRPPFLIRDGQGGNEWMPATDVDPERALRSAILPEAEMPQLVDPPAGFVVTANNDPLGLTLDGDPLNRRRPGGGLYYLAPRYISSARAQRITDRLAGLLAAGPVSASAMRALQADVVLHDATVLAPWIMTAFARAQTSDTPRLRALALDPRIADAVARLSAWDGRAPTGVAEGWDAGDGDGRLRPPDEQEIRDSVATTIYSVWRGRMLRNVVDAPLLARGLPTPPDIPAMTALRRLLDDFAVRRGIGASGIDFFAVPGIADADTRRDILVLQSLAEALDRLGGSAFAAVFAGSRDPDDWRWGRLHRLVVGHPLGGGLGLTSESAGFPPPFPGLEGLPIDGGWEVVDSSGHRLRAEGADAFVVDYGPARRFVAALGPGRVRAASSLPGGASGVPATPWFANLFGRWLANEATPLRHRKWQLRDAVVERVVLTPSLPAAGG